ncbi:thiosulfate oxidation carrier complex protein SoxZ [Rubrivivax rivuli]|uniref:Thiosulfate oxidation carrier complex protein SoxZ n=1 Tax=Rubrivivax rivuli TaxID=1862385 RepID=A0A437RL99_9BURK|nr:thiosulfate oxidation carrier complex protein SoxZ [Rubrivivax rivuli]RVU47558.1 thiosulfate oxidation carrier complex protein SoxZ [Rubrivivax rivuli]
MSNVRALLRLPATARPGEVVEVRLLLQHPMETGFRPDAGGRTVPRNILRRIEARFEGELVFAADLFPAITANPFLAFPLRATRSGTLVVGIEGDNGVSQRETATLTVA